MSNEKSPKLKKWRANYAATVTALACLYSVVVSWGDNWFLTVILALGVLVCGTIGIFDIKRTLNENTKGN
ncbi:hypothetical protein J2Y03_000803 [Neobacillus niacini]|uniref:hypothetical protein n=1 Tax=Neobacillus niacini TaxID=86668 RepID=UPI00285D0850|nr:hypothetical protein [Neobacillus niacini]MDR7075815.1 hypothetical protein [Neobacillus niacini]